MQAGSDTLSDQAPPGGRPPTRHAGGVSAMTESNTVENNRVEADRGNERPEADKQAKQAKGAKEAKEAKELFATLEEANASRPEKASERMRVVAVVKGETTRYVWAGSPNEGMVAVAR